MNAVRGFTDMVSRLVTERRPVPAGGLPGPGLATGVPGQGHPVVQDPPGGPRVKLVDADGEPVGGAGPAEAVPDGLGHQVPLILDVLAAAGIATGGAEGYEADDVIGTLCARERGDPVEVVSGDRDLLQLVRDEPTPVRVVYVGRGLAKAEMFGPHELAAKYRVPAERAGDGLRRDGHAARRPLRRAARGGRDRREDRRDAGVEVRLLARAGGRRAATGRTPGSPPAPGPSWPPPPTTSRWSSRWCESRWTPRSTWTGRTSCRPARGPGPAGRAGRAVGAGQLRRAAERGAGVDPLLTPPGRFYSTVRLAAVAPGTAANETA